MAQNSKKKNNQTRRKAITIRQRADFLGVTPRQYLQRRARRNLRRLVDGNTFNISIAILIIISVVFVFIEFLMPPSPQRYRIEDINNIITWVFVFELSLRYIVAPNKRIFFSSYWIDILAVLPVLRVFRTLRVVRLLRLLRFTRALIIIMRRSGWLSDRFERYFGSFGALLVVTVMLVLCGALALHIFEQPVHVTQGSFIESLWVTTFLFISGEITSGGPLTLAGKFTASLISVAGLIVFAVMVGTITASMTAYFRTKMDAKDLELSDLRNHLIICGWDRVGGIVLSELEAVSDVWDRGAVIVAETDSDIVKEAGVKYSGRVFHIRDDFTKIEVLKAAGARRAKTAIVLADKGRNLGDQDRDARTVLAALTLEKLNPEIFTCAELLNEQNATHLRIAGVEEIISRTTITAGLFAASAANEGISPIISDILTHHEGSYFKKIVIPEDLVDRPFIDAYDHFKRNHDATVIALDLTDEKGHFKQHVNPPSDHMMRKGDRLTLILKRDSALCDLHL